MSARHVRDFCFDSYPEWMWIPLWCSLIGHWVNRSGVQQPDAAVCLWHFPLTFSVTPPWNSSCVAHTPLLRAKPDPQRPIFRRKLFFIAPKAPRLLPVWPHAASPQVVRPGFLSSVRWQLWGQAFGKDSSQPGLVPFNLYVLSTEQN